MSHERLRLRFVFGALALALDFAIGQNAAAAKEPWADAIAAFERQDRDAPSPQGAILFVGSSSIRLWDLPRSFPKLQTINRGFGGSQAADSARYAQQLVIKHRPAVVVFYAGDNDLAFGKSPEEVCADVRSLVSQVAAALPQSRFLYLAVKPSLARRKLLAEQQRTNRLIADMLAEFPLAKFIDTATPLLGDDGQPRAELFVKDGLHLSPAGYDVWAAVLAPHLHE